MVILYIEEFYKVIAEHIIIFYLMWNVYCVKKIMFSDFNILHICINQPIDTLLKVTFYRIKLCNLN